MIVNVWDVVADGLIPPRGKYLSDPVRWAKDRLRVDLWSKQQAVLESVRDNKLTAVKSCNTVGKSFSAATEVCHWLDCYPEGSARVVTTAPSGDQVKGVLWHEINQLHAMGRLDGRTNHTEWWYGKYLAAIGRKPGEYSDAAFSGYHAQHLLVVIDEAGGVPSPLWDAALTLTNNEGSKILAIGNPNNPQSRFAEVCRADSGWNVVHISAFDSPNLTGERVTPIIAKNLVTPDYIAQLERTHGKRSPLYAISVLGEFPIDMEDGVIPWSWVVACRNLIEGD